MFLVCNISQYCDDSGRSFAKSPIKVLADCSGLVVIVAAIPVNGQSADVAGYRVHARTNHDSTGAIPMKTLKLVMLAAAGLSFVSQTAFADTLPGQAVPTAHGVHGVKMVRFAEKRHPGVSRDGEGGMSALGGAGLGGLAGLAAGLAIGLSSKSDKIGPPDESQAGFSRVCVAGSGDIGRARPIKRHMRGPSPMAPIPVCVWGVFMTRAERRKSSPKRKPKVRFSYKTILKDPNGALTCALLALCLVLGGGGTSNPHTEIVLECCAAAIAALGLWFSGDDERRRSTPRAAFALAVLALLIPIAQLIPLPPAFWHGLPGRQPEIDSLALIGQAQRWMPLTLTPARTFAALLAILVEVGLFLAVARLDLSGRMRLCAVIIAVGTAAAVLGGFQLSQAGGYRWVLYEDSNIGWMVGFHANRNAATDTFQIAILAIAAFLGTTRAHKSPPAVVIGLAVLLMLVLAIAAVLTGSRTGILLLPLTTLFAAWLAWPLLKRAHRAVSWGILLVAPVMVVPLAAAGPVQQALSRFSLDGEHRWDIWHDTVHAIAAVWPVGSGVGSFQVAYSAAQSIERMQPLLDLRAHNDWLEWTLEAGVPGLVVLAVIGAILLVRNIAALRESLQPGADRRMRAQAVFATGTLLHLGLHGAFDYPVRSMALAALVATAAAMLMPKIDRRANAVFGILCTAQKDARADLWQMAAASAKSVPERVEAVLQNRWRPCVTAVQQYLGLRAMAHLIRELGKAVNLYKAVAVLAFSVGLAGCESHLSNDLPTREAAYKLIPPIEVAPPQTKYELFPGDQLTYSVVGEPDMSIEALTVDEAGFIQIPLAGSVQVGGLSTIEAKQLIEQKLGARYIKDPSVTLNLTVPAPKQVSVEGEVTQPGTYTVNRDTTMLGALAAARSPTNKARNDEVIIFRTIAGKRMAARFNLDRVRAGLDPDPQVVNGDVVVVGVSRGKAIYRDLLTAAPFFNVFAQLRLK
eukprot:gene15547-15694_t